MCEGCDCFSLKTFICVRSQAVRWPVWEYSLTSVSNSDVFVGWYTCVTSKQLNSSCALDSSFISIRSTGIDHNKFWNPSVLVRDIQEAIAEFRSNSISTERRICFAHGEQDQAAKFLLAIITDAPMVMVPHFCELHERINICFRKINIASTL